MEEIDPRILEILKEYGVDDLYPPQREAIPYILEKKNLVMAVPTAGGKSLIAYISIINKLIKEGGKALYIVPLRALAREKYQDLLLFRKLGLKIGISTGDLDKPDQRLGRYDIIVCTSEKADSLLRHNTNWLSSVSVLVVDEIHLIHDYTRGPTLEVVISRFKKMNRNIQIIALSATIKNAGEIAEWLDAELVISDWRPVRLKEGVFYDGTIYFSDGSIREISDRKDAMISLVVDSISNGGQVLIFVNNRKSTITLAQRLSPSIRSLLFDSEIKSLLEVSRKITFLQDSTPLGEVLSNCIKDGAAFHHAGLSGEQRKIVEEGFKKGMIKCIVATPTLAAGVNIPARRVIIRDLWRYDSNYGMRPIPVLEYKQQAGRAGRPGYDLEGEAVVIAKDESHKRHVFENYILAEPEPIFSKLGNESSLRMHILSSISSGFTIDKESIFDFIQSTFYAHQSDIYTLDNTIDNIISFLSSNGFIESQDGIYSPTLFGKKTSSLYIDPLTALRLRYALESRNIRSASSISYLQAICSTPDMRSLYIKRGDDWVEDKLEMERELLLIPVPNPSDADYEWFLSYFKTASLLEDWINEISEAKISSKYGVGPGDIHAIVEIAEWLLHAMRELSRIYNFESVHDLTELIVRVHNGCKKELLNLISLQNVGRVRARALYDAGFKTTDSLKSISIDKLAQIPTIGRRIAKSIKKQVGDAMNKDLVDDGL